MSSIPLPAGFSATAPLVALFGQLQVTKTVRKKRWRWAMTWRLTGAQGADGEVMLVEIAAGHCSEGCRVEGAGDPATGPRRAAAQRPIDPREWRSIGGSASSPSIVASRRRGAHETVGAGPLATSARGGSASHRSAQVAWGFTEAEWRT